MLHGQTWKCWRTKSAEDLSWGFLLLYGAGLVMLFTFAVSKGLWPIYIPGLFEQFMLLMQCTMKLVYDRQARETRHAKQAVRPKPFAARHRAKHTHLELTPTPPGCPQARAPATAREDGRLVEPAAPAPSSQHINPFLNVPRPT